ncbi:purine catabolism regulatory protein [Halobacillus karajensis]|uniref:Purine catabolism regulatory protein n=1 Tax=Halobacillus karajensis TaxID=195088 RepID=A0A024P7Z5_9BACI|nr:PucR family transcriptional regulator [Halobacillus karajensis]CDQ20963.1 Purine catabolism regulatory protein [Halobacillus karajensis]CDQ24973.1 Purine catabolism regulatory protein [Halobacillus karajensis]CDQ28666.1 Purine catabolism regulatory protein [Halobacillus karajensis]SEH97977.1 purine catabolism regulatory protein [Halobacillus karajensis]
MNEHMSIENILKRTHFKSAEVIAGRTGTDRLVKWVHVFEVIEVRRNLKGGELVLSTGFGWKDDDKLFLRLLEQLIDRNVAGICIELGSFVDYICDEAIALADAHGFPIILFHEEVSFVEITQDIHADLINQQYELITNLEDYSQRLNKRLLSIDNYFDILKNLQQYLNCQLVYIAKDHTVVTLPALREKEREEILAELSGPRLFSKRVLKQPVQVFEREFANIYLLSNYRDFGEFERLLLDRTATALAQYLLRELYTEEKRKVKEAEWLSEWLQGDHEEEEIRDRLAVYKLDKTVSGAIVLTIKLNMVDRQYPNPDVTYLNMLVHNIFDQNGYYVFPVEKRHQLTFILLNRKGEEDWKKRVKRGVERLKKISLLNDTSISSFQIAGGKYVKRLHKLHESYQTAEETLTLQEKLPEDQFKFFYDDLHMYRLISLVHQHSNLDGLVEEYLGPIISYDEKNNTSLLETLRVYLACNGSKKETASKIFVVRQTLYHRLEKLEKLLGPDFMECEKRQVIEFALLAYEYQRAVH